MSLGYGMAVAWTEERTAELRRLFEEGVSMSQIAAEMGIKSRNSIIGKLHRLGLNRGHKPAQLNKPPRVWRKGGPAFRRLKQPAAPPIAPAPARAIPDAPSRPCGLLELTNERCRYPISDDGPPHVFCGALDADLGNGRPYCRQHSRMAYRRPGEAA